MQFTTQIVSSVYLAFFFTKLISNVMYVPTNKIFNTASTSYLGCAGTSV